MKEYYSIPKYFKRFDNIYEVYNNGKLKRNNKYPNIHCDVKQQKRDIAGEYVLMSNDFVYLGNKTIKLDIIDKYGPKRQETKTYSDDIALKIINECKRVAKNSNYNPNDNINRKNIQNCDNLTDCKKRLF